MLRLRRVRQHPCLAAACGSDGPCLAMVADRPHWHSVARGDYGGKLVLSRPTENSLWRIAGVDAVFSPLPLLNGETLEYRIVMTNGLDDLARKLKELGEATSALDGDITQLNFDPDDPASIEAAIQQMEAAIDERVSNYTHNDLVTGVAGQLKKKYRVAILERATTARLEGNDEK